MPPLNPLVPELNTQCDLQISEFKLEGTRAAKMDNAYKPPLAL